MSKPMTGAEIVEACGHVENVYDYDRREWVSTGACAACIDAALVEHSDNARRMMWDLMARAVAEERERCARVAVEHGRHGQCDGPWYCNEGIAEAIRALRTEATR